MIKRNNRQEKSQTQEYYKDYDLQSINLNMTQRYSRKRKKLRCFQKKENSNSIKKEKCYNCDIKEYYINECRKLKKIQQIARMR